MIKSRIIIGTSGWGSKISFNKSYEIGSKLIEFGINNFDTAPNYGSGYSHHILNQLSKNYKMSVDTKFGDITIPSFKELAKRIYRFHDYKSFKRSLGYLQLSRNIRKNFYFWRIENLKKNLDFFFEDLKDCNINILYLHSPPLGIINKQYLIELDKFLKSKKIKIGISWPNEKDIDLLIDQFSHIQLQISFEFYLKHQNKLIKNFRSLYINSILKNKNLTTNNKENYSLINDILKDFQYENNYKFVIGINSMNSFEKLTNYSFNVY